LVILIEPGSIAPAEAINCAASALTLNSALGFRKEKYEESSFFGNK